ncbi:MULTISPECIES: hypothetical protein [unclassified Nocardioides]|uniref:hypothetical protein n=1 Tax=unclassified Nocardioides TaxID=2615069 RepID=UPI0007038E6C|nr:MULTISPECIES: hypothetical protein [unclassified Nocardioides]KRC50142.1 hypothetical protein ASE19_16145 [Nocardioides sp. Root79]KRC75609.1 hypothetical protein ASE20_22165 [Nocardioides sp. Root240]
MLRRTTAILTLAICLLVPQLSGPARAEGDMDIDPQDLLAQVPGILQALLVDRTDMLRCPELIGGTIGLPERADETGRQGVDEGNPLRAGDPSAAPAGLPDQVVFRSTTQTFNRRYQFVLAAGNIWYRSNTEVTGIREPWAPLVTSACFAGRLVGISADDDELIAVDSDRWVYGMDGALRTPQQFNWSLRWGPLFWTGPGRMLPTGISTWSWSVVSQVEDLTWPDDAGNAHAVGAGKVSHIWTLSHGGQRLTYLDPWLAKDESYEMCGPHRGRFRAVNMSASGSTIFVVGPHGDLFTRLYDFDIAGADPLFFDYAYADQRGLAKPRIQLPSPAWIEQPKVPGTITSRISIHKVGRGAIHRQLRVEGRRSGQVGYWHKDIRARAWSFTPTGGALVGRVLDNPASDTSAAGLGGGEDGRYVGTVPGGTVTIADFNTYCTPSTVRVRLTTGESFTLRLHTVDNIREFRRARGLDTQPRMFNGTLEVPPALRSSADPQVRAFVTKLGSGRFIKANLDGTTSRLVFRTQPWRLSFVSPG